MTRKLVYTICRPVIRKCPKCYCVFIPFILTLAFIAYLYGAQQSGIITDADMIRIPVKIVDSHQNNVKNEQNRAMLPAIIVQIPINEQASVQDTKQLTPAESPNRINGKGNSDEKANKVVNVRPQNEGIETNIATVKNVESHSPPQRGSSKTNTIINNSTVDSPPAAVNHENDSNTVLNRTNEKNAENKIPVRPETNNGPTNGNIASSNDTIANKSSANFDGSGGGDIEAIPNRFQMNATDKFEAAESPNSNISVQNVKVGTGAMGPLIPLNKHQIVNIPKPNGNGNASSINQLASSNKTGNNAQSIS